MSRIIKIGARKLPTMLGAGILGVSIVGLTAAAFGATMTIGIELVSAAVGMALGGRYS